MIVDFKVGGKLRDVLENWWTIVDVDSTTLTLQSDKDRDVRMCVPIIFVDSANYRPPTKTAIEWFAKLPPGTKERAIRYSELNCRPDKRYSSLAGALYPLTVPNTPEGAQFWLAVREAAEGKRSYPTPPDLGYGTHRSTGEPIKPPEDMVLLPEGAPVDRRQMFYCGRTKAYFGISHVNPSFSVRAYFGYPESKEKRVVDQVYLEQLLQEVRDTVKKIEEAWKILKSE